MLNLYAESAVNLTPSNHINNTVTIPLSSSWRLSRLSGSQTPKLGSPSVTSDIKSDDIFAETFLASHGTVYFRQSHTYPRSFLWRVIEGRKILELRCVDVARSEHNPDEAYLTVRFEFADLILPGCVAVSDAGGQDALSIFVVTGKKDLYTVTAPLDLFRHGDASKRDSRNWCKISTPSSLAISHPHQLYAHSPYEIFLSFDNGKLQRLSRKAEDDGSHWGQDYLDDSSWSASIRGMVAWQPHQSIPYGLRTLSASAANGMVASSDSTFLYTICLNHTLQVWNLTTGKLVVSKDLLNRPIRPQEPRTLLSPATPSFLRLFKADLMDHTVLVTFSPLDDGHFKFWHIRGGRTELLTVGDKFPVLNLKPPDPDPTGNTIWSLSGFDVRPATSDDPPELWVLWRNNNIYRVYTLQFSLENIAQDWERNWVQVWTTQGPKVNPPEIVAEDPIDPTQRWMTYLFWPNRYPHSVLETALNIYQDSTRVKGSGASRKRPLLERICAVVAANVNLRKYNDSELDFGRFTSDTDVEWRKYWQVVERLNEKRKAPLGLVYDSYAGMVMVPKYDQCACIRECNDLELAQANSPFSLKSLRTIAGGRWPHRKIKASRTVEQVSQLLEIAREFTASFSPELSRECDNAVEIELFSESDVSITDRINDLYEKCNFVDLVSNEAFDKVLSGLDSLGGLEALGSELIPAILALLPDRIQGTLKALRSTIFGSEIVEAGLNDTISLGRQTLHGLLLLIVFVECETEQEGRPGAFNSPKLYVSLLEALKEYEKKFWLLSHERRVPIDFTAPSELALSPKRGVMTGEKTGPSRQVTLLMVTKGQDVKPQPAVGSPQMYLLTEMLSDIEVWIEGSPEITADDSSSWIQCNLIAHDETDWASDFSRFQPNNAWSVYVKGRLCLARREFEQAALHFQEATYWSGHGKAIGVLSDMAAGLLSVEDADDFNNGSRRYLHHVVTLFEGVKAYSFVADFARLALAAPAEGDEQEGKQDEIVQSLFTAELQCSRYPSAFSALVRLNDGDSRRDAAVMWTDAVLGRNSWSGLQATECVDLLRRLPISLHADIAATVDVHLSALAEQQAYLPGLLSGGWDDGKGITDYLEVLYAVRAGRRDYRGAVSVLMDRLYLVKRSSLARNDPQARLYRTMLLTLINTLSCVAPEEAYILTTHQDGRSGRHRQSSGGQDKKKRQIRVIVTLNDLRREYQQLLDKCSRIERGDFDFDVGSGDEDEEEESGFFGEANGIGAVDAMEF